MNIAHLQAFLRSQAGFLSSAGGSAQVIKDFAAFADSLEPFADFDIAKIAELVRHASHHRETGDWLPLLASKKPTTRQPAAPKKTPNDLIRDAVQRLEALYEGALDADFRLESVDAEIDALGKIKGLTIPHLTTIAREVGLIDIPKKKPEILAALGRRIKSRREFHDRTQVNSIENRDDFSGTPGMVNQAAT